MVDSIAYYISNQIKKANPEKTASVEVMQYSLIIIINSSLIVFESLLIGWLSGKLLETGIVLSSFALLRLFSGGLHMKSTVSCNIISTLICTTIPHLPILNKNFTFGLTLICLMILLILAPKVDMNSNIDKKYYMLLKWLSIIIVSFNFYFLSYIVCIAFLVQSLTLLPFRKEES